jgi:hypothetical protein
MDSAQCESKDPDLKSYADAGCRYGCTRGFERAKERGDSASLGAKDFKSNQAKDNLRANMGQRSLRKEALSKVLRKDFRCKVLKNCKEQGLKESR